MELKSFKRGRKSIVFCRTINPGSENPAADEENGELYLSDEDAELCKTAIRECEAYIEGKRGQGLLNFDEDKDALNAQFGAKEDDAQTSFDLPASPETTKRRKRQAAGAAE